MRGCQPIIVPPATTVVAAQQVISGPPVPPIARIRLYSPDEWEAFTNEWACTLFQGKEVVRSSGAGDKGVDIAVFGAGQGFAGIWDGYQCKHYDHPLRPSDIYVELGKVLWFSSNGDYSAPRSYTFIAPCGIGTKLNSLLKSPDKLKQELIINWEKSCRKGITDSKEIALDGVFRAYVDAFDFSIFKGKQPLALIDEHRSSPYHLSRFGGGFPARPITPQPPTNIGVHETRYVEKLYLAYADHLKKSVNSIADLGKPVLREHFSRQREAFYQAESLRIFVRDKVEPGTFERLQNEIYAGVVDTQDDEFDDGYQRVVAVTKAAQEMAIAANPIALIAQTQDRRGICHQLANDDRLKWTR
ncbi:ABC-three component system protein [Rhodopseudomonas palustris]|uniref:ABC-three component system protein n=1 Tax=Rhodopseudomonas palustris TaxID=1076 RepID=UPI0021F2D4AF|nr:ABC-three component system protein [Rhodopseudomonas palustris]UYO53073.1 hypothetical protein KQX61_21125 [Rhodopseudomonas palustris]